MTKKKNARKTTKANRKLKPQGLRNNIFFYIFLIVGAYLIFGYTVQNELNKDERPISEVIAKINNDEVQDIIVADDEITVLLRNGTEFTSKKESLITFEEILTNNNIDRSKILGKIETKQKLTWERLATPLITIGFPLLLVVFIMRQMKGAGSDILSFGKTRARLFSKDMSKITFKDVAGNEEAKKEMIEIVDFLKQPAKYRKLGARIPKGILLVGPSGVGKTLLAKAIAGEANVPFYSMAGSEFMEMLVGVGSARARDLFKVAKATQPSLIFIDEIDAIGRQRGMGIGGGHDEREQTLNQILIEMDGFDPRTNVIVLAATNRPDMLDPALIRAGRFDRRITIPLPDLTDRQGIIKLHMNGKPFAEDVNIATIAKKTVGFSGADIENMLNESAILAARSGKDKIHMGDIEEAALKVTMGAERKTLRTEHERKIAAYHEAGHALVATNCPEMDAVNRISIVARGGSLGHTSFPPERDRYSETKTRLLSIISTILGGRAAETIIFNEHTTGASDDIEKSTEIARRMVTEYGMSNLGPISYDGKDGRFWLARQMGESAHYSQEIAAKIDAEIKLIIDNAFEKAKNILMEHKDKLDKVAARLLEKETIDGDEFRNLLETAV